MLLTLHFLFQMKFFWDLEQHTCRSQYGFGSPVVLLVGLLALVPQTFHPIGIHPVNAMKVNVLSSGFLVFCLAWFKTQLAIGKLAEIHFGYNLLNTGSSSRLYDNYIFKIKWITAISVSLLRMHQNYFKISHSLWYWPSFQTPYDHYR